MVIVNYNAGHHLLAALSGLSKQSIAPDKVIVVDNASEDGSALEAQQQYPGFSFRYLNTNTGFAVANNVAIAELTNFDYVALLNPDAVPDVNWLKSLLDMARLLPEYGSFASRMLCDHDQSLIDGAGDVYHVSGLPWRRFYQGNADALGKFEQDVFSCCAGAALYKLSAIRAAGLFDEGYFCYVEDVDLGFRLQLLGYSCRYVPSAIVSHVGSATTGLNSDFSLYYGHRNLALTYIKNMPCVLFWLFLPLHLLLNLFSLFWFLFKGRPRVIFKAKWDALIGLPKMWGKRKVVQQTRTSSAISILHLLDKRLLIRKGNK